MYTFYLTAHQPIYRCLSSAGVLLGNCRRALRHRDECVDDCVIRLKSDDKYICVLPRLVSLLNIVSETPSHIQAQESIAVSLHHEFYFLCTNLTVSSWFSYTGIFKLVQYPYPKVQLCIRMASEGHASHTAVLAVYRLIVCFIFWRIWHKVICLELDYLLMQQFPGLIRSGTIWKHFCTACDIHR